MKKVRTKRSKGSGGFTLVELLVAMMAGLLVAIAAVSFSKQSTLVFAQEARIAAAQMSVLAGFQRLQADVARAAYMSTTDMRREHLAQRLCAPDFDEWDDPVKDLASVRLRVADDGRIRLRIAGNLGSSEMFPVRTIESLGTAHTVYLQTNNGPMTRAGFVGGVSGTDEAFQNVFRPGQFIRITDDQGKFEYAMIHAASFDTAPMITTTKPLPLKGDISMETGPNAKSSVECGIGGFGIGVMLNPVSVVEYGVGSLADVPPYNATIYHEDFVVPEADDNRTELVRQELINGDTPTGIPDLVAEFAVDLSVGLLSTATGGTGAVPRGSLAYYPPGPAAIAATATAGASTVLEPVTGPAAVRALELRLVVRSREADRAVGIDNVDTNPLATGGFQFRVPMSDGPNPKWARARTLTATVALMNHRGDAW